MDNPLVRRGGETGKRGGSIGGAARLDRRLASRRMRQTSFRRAAPQARDQPRKLRPLAAPVEHAHRVGDDLFTSLSPSLGAAAAFLRRSAVRRAVRRCYARVQQASRAVEHLVMYAGGRPRQDRRIAACGYWQLITRAGGAAPRGPHASRPCGRRRPFDRGIERCDHGTAPSGLPPIDFADAAGGVAAFAGWPRAQHSCDLSAGPDHASVPRQRTKRSTCSAPSSVVRKLMSSSASANSASLSACRWSNMRGRRCVTSQDR